MMDLESFGLFDSQLGNWYFQAACQGKDPNLFFPRRGESNEAARSICAGCSVREECLEAALLNREPAGIWGGTTVRERRAIAKARGLTPAPRTGVDYQ